MIRIKEIKFDQFVLEKLWPLLKDHYEEIAHHKDKIKLNPDFTFYMEQAKKDALHLVVAEDEGRIVGYFVSIVAPNPHYKDHLFGVNDILYVDPEYRGGSTAVRMFKYAEEKLKQRGVSVLTLHMKTDHPFESFAEKLGYSKAEYNYTKWIGD